MVPKRSYVHSTWPLTLLLVLLNLTHGFMSNEMSSTRYFTDKGILPPLRLKSAGAMNNTTIILSESSSSALYTTYSSSVLSLHGSSVPVTYTNDPKSVYRWLSDHLPYGGCTIGFDVESLPKTRRKPGEKKSAFDHAATVQLATSDSCLVIHLARRSGKHSMACAPILKAILCDEQFVKAGCALDEDLMSLYTLWGGLDAKSRLDLGFLDGRAGNRLGLKTLSKGLLGVDLPKPKDVAVSDWSAVPLTESQIVYSARDAWAGAAIAKKLAGHDPDTFSHEQLVNYLPLVEPSISELVSKQQQRDRAKRDLRELMCSYQSKAADLPEDVQSQIQNLRGIIKKRVIDPHLIFEVEHLLCVEK